MPAPVVAASTSQIAHAGVYLALTIAVAVLVDRLLRDHSGGISRAIARTLPLADETRLRVARRLVLAAIVFIGVMAALVQLPEVGTVARGLLASAGITALIVGFAARSVLANLVSGVIVALAQPVRIGDHVAIDDFEGVVEEVRLTYSYIRASDNSRIVIPNEQLASKVIRNFTIADARREALDVAAAFSRGRSPDRLPSLAVTELGVDAVHLRLTVWQDSKADADRAAAGLRFALEEHLAGLGAAAGTPPPAS